MLAYLNNKLFSLQKARHLCFKEIASRLTCTGIVLYRLIKVQIPEIRLVTCDSIKFKLKIRDFFFFFSILARGPRAFLIGKISDINSEFGEFSEYFKLIIFFKLT